MRLLKSVIIFTLVLSIFSTSCKKEKNSSEDKTSVPSLSNAGCGGASTVTDIDGNIYNIIQIGSQCWLKENLKTTRYQNGDTLRTNVTNANWFGTLIGAYAVYGSNAIYGKLYNWAAVTDSRKICPLGYHVPTSKEWDTLIIFLGGNNQAGPKLKSTTLWTPSTVTPANNITGFTAVPSGMRNAFGGSFQDLGNFAYFWSSDSYFTEPYCLMIYFSNDRVDINTENPKDGYSCRCVGD